MNLPPLPDNQFTTVVTVAASSAAFTWLLTEAIKLAGFPMNAADQLAASVFVASVAYVSVTLFLTWRNRQKA